MEMADNPFNTMRKGKGYSIRELSEVSGIPRRTLEHWSRNGTERATVGNLRKAADAMGCDIRALID